MFTGLEHVFMGLELMFNGHEYKIIRDVRKKHFIKNEKTTNYCANIYSYFSSSPRAKAVGW